MLKNRAPTSLVTHLDHMGFERNTTAGSHFSDIRGRFTAAPLWKAGLRTFSPLMHKIGSVYTRLKTKSVIQDLKSKLKDPDLLRLIVRPICSRTFAADG
jgi:hypothetical protein